MPTNDGGPAFPCEYNMTTESGASRPATRGQYGLTLRDYFAAKAMQAMLSNFRVVNHRNPLIEGDVTTMEPHREMALDYNIQTGVFDGAVEIASDAYAIADAMLRERGRS